MTDLFSKIKEVTEIPAISGPWSSCTGLFAPTIDPSCGRNRDRWSRWDLWGQTFNNCRCSSYLSSCPHGRSWFYDPAKSKLTELSVLSQSEVGIRWSSAANASNSLHATDVNTLLFRDLFLLIWHVEQVDQPYLPLATSSLMRALALKPKLKAMGSVLEMLWSPDGSAILTANGKTCHLQSMG